MSAQEPTHQLAVSSHVPSSTENSSTSTGSVPATPRSVGSSSSSSTLRRRESGAPDALARLAKAGNGDGLILAVRRAGVTVQQINNLLGALSANEDALVEALAGYSDKLCTTLVHEIFRAGDWRALDAVEQRFPKRILRAQEGASRQTVYHTFAQRPRSSCADAKTYDEYMPLFFQRARRENLSIADAEGCTPIHYLARYRHEVACARLRSTFGDQLFRMPDKSGTLAIDLLAARLDHDLQRAEHAVTKLRTQLDIAQDSIEQYERLYGAVAQSTLQKSVSLSVQTAGLERIESNYEELQREKARLETERRRQTDTIRRIELERDAAKAQAAKAQAELRRAGEELQNQRQAQQSLHGELERHRGAVTATEEEIDDLQAEYDELSRKLAKLAREKQDAEEEAEDGAEHADSLARSLRETQGAKEQLEKRMRDAERTRQELAQQREEADRKYREAEARTGELEASYAEAQQTSSHLRTQLDAAAEEQARLTEEAEGLRADLERVSAENERRREEQLARMDEISRQRDAVEAQLNDERQLIRKAEEAHEKRLAEIRQQLRDEQRRAAEAMTKLDKADESAKAIEETLERQARLEAELTAQKRAAEESLAQMKEQLANNDQRFRDVQAEAQRQQEEAQKWQRIHVEEMDRAKTELQRTASRLAVADAEIDEKKMQITQLETRAEIAEEEAIKLRRMQEALSVESLRLQADAAGRASKRSRSNSIRRPKGASIVISAPMPIAANGAGSKPGTPRNGETLRPRTLRKRSASSLRGIDLPEAVSASMALNAKANRYMWNKIAMLVQRGQYESLRTLLGKEVGLSPNTIDGEGRCLLEIAMIAMRDAYKLKTGESKRFDKKEIRERVRRLSTTCQIIMDSGGDWDGLEDFVRAAGGEDAFPDEVWKRIDNRDDYSPFCKALLAQDTLGVSEHIENVENLDRVPATYKSHGYTYLMAAVVLQSAAIVQQLVLKGADTMAKDKQGRTALHLALTKVKDTTTRNLMVEYLLAGGADPNAVCSYKSFISYCRDEARKREKTAKKSSARSLKLALKLGAKETEADRRAKESSESTAYGTPLKLAKALADDELIDLMENYRYRRATPKKLCEYVVKCVSLNALHERMCRLDDDTDEDETSSGEDPLTQLFSCYKYTYTAFNPYFENVHLMRPIVYVLRRVAEREGVHDDATADERALLIKKRLKADELIAFQQSADASSADKVRGNANNRVVLANKLLECIEALQKQWFEVRDMVNDPAKAIYPDAICEAMRQFVVNDEVDNLAYLLRQGNMIFGKVDVNTVVDDEYGYTPIEVAAQHGKLRVLEWLLDRQRGRAKQPGSDGKTPIGIAMSNHQAAALVAIDHWAFRNNEYRHKYENGDYYRLIDPKTKQNVLHQCAGQRRDDLLRFVLAFDGIAGLVDATDEMHRTPLDVACTLAQFTGAGDPEADRAAKECVDVLRSRELQDETGLSAQPPPPSLEPPPALPASNGHVAQPPPVSLEDSDEDADPPPPPSPKLELPPAVDAPPALPTHASMPALDTAVRPQTGSLASVPSTPRDGDDCDESEDESQVPDTPRSRKSRRKGQKKKHSSHREGSSRRKDRRPGAEK